MPLDSSTNSGPTNDEKLDALRLYQRQRRRVDEEQGVLRALLKRLKAEGHNTKAIVATVQASKRDSADVEIEYRDTLHLMALRKVISLEEILTITDDLQVSQKTAREDDLWDAEDNGYRAGRHGADRKENPYAAGTENATAWDKWWSQGKRSATAELGPNEKQADASKEKPGRKAKQAKLIEGPANGEDQGDGEVVQPSTRAAGKKAKAAKGGTGRPRGRPKKNAPIPEVPTTLPN